MFPVYKYHQKLSDVQEHYEPTLAWFTGLLLIMFWAFFSNAQVQPPWFGTLFIIGLELLVLLTIINFRQITVEGLDSAVDFINDDTVKKAWIDTKMIYAK